MHRLPIDMLSTVSDGHRPRRTDCLAVSPCPWTTPTARSGSEERGVADSGMTTPAFASSESSCYTVAASVSQTVR